MEEHRRWDADEAKPLEPIKRYEGNIVEYKFTHKEYKEKLQGHLSRIIHNKCHNEYLQKKRIVQSKIKEKIMDEMIKEVN